MAVARSRSSDKAGSAEKIPPPDYSEVLVATTWSCNLACSYCFVDARALTTPRVAAMSPEVARMVVDRLESGLADVATINVHLYGGEPLTNVSAMRAIVERIADKPSGRFQLSITTNGTVFSDEVLALLDAGQFHVVLSIDGPPEVHDQCRRGPSGQPSHETVMRFLHRLRAQTRCRVRGSAVVRAGWTLAEAEGYLRSLPVDAIKAQAVRVPADHPSALSKIERHRYLDQLDAVGDQVIDDLEHGRSPRDDRFSSRVLQLLRGGYRESYCGAGATSFGVTPDGTFLPCVLLGAGENHLGTIADEPEVWRHAGRRWCKRRKARPECMGCEALPLCGGGCPAVGAVCGEDECVMVRKNCEVARRIHAHFRDRQTALLLLAGIS